MTKVIGGVMQSAMLVCAVDYVVVACRIIVTTPVKFRLWIGSYLQFNLKMSPNVTKCHQVSSSLSTGLALSRERSGGRGSSWPRPCGIALAMPRSLCQRPQALCSPSGSSILIYAALYIIHIVYHREKGV